MYELPNNIKIKFEYIYLIGLALAVFTFTLSITELSETQTSINDVVNILRYCGIFLIIIKSLFFTMYKKRELIIWLILLAVFLLIYEKTGNKNLFFIALLSLGALNIDSRLILKYHMIAQILAVVFTFFLMQNNIIINLIYYRNNKMRPAYGFIYPTALSAVLFSIFISYTILKRFTFNIVEYIFIVFLIYFTLIVLDARLDGYLMVIVCVSTLFNKKIINIIAKAKESICLIISMILICLSILFSYLFNSSSSFFNTLDSFFNSRLSQGHIALTQYPISWFGQKIQMQGMGGQQGLHQNFTQYFYIDNSFIQILVIDGLVLLLIVLMLIALFFIKWHRQKKYILEIALLFICMASIVEDSLVSSATSIIFVIMVANNNWSRDLIRK